MRKISHMYGFRIGIDNANKALSLLISVFLRITTSKIPVSFADAEESIIQPVITLGICSSNHYSAFLSHAAFLPSPGESVIYRGSTSLIQSDFSIS